MGKKIKLIWDFRGPQAKETARHFEHHLRENPLFYTDLPAGVTDISDMHSFAFLIVGESEMPAFRDALKPHRGVLAD